MKTRRRLLYLGVAIVAACLILESCNKTNNELKPQPNALAATTSSTTALALTKNAGLIAYKNSNHHPFVGFLVGDGSDPIASYNPANAPDSADFLEFFAGNDANRADWRAAQAMGTRIVVCHFLADAYFDGSTQDGGNGGTTPNSTSTYDHWAKAMYQQHIVKDSLDGIDLDIESGTVGGGVSRASYPNLLASVAKFFGPNSTSALTLSMGKKPVFFYDTDGSLDGNQLVGAKNNYDYVLFQAYTTGNHYWFGNDTSDFGSLVSGYGKDKLIFLVNGDSFIYPNGSQDVPGGDAKATSDLLSYAHWVVDNSGVGVGAYRMSRDYNHTPPFAASRQAIQIMNPTSGSDATTTGVQFYQDANYGGTATQLIPKGSYTMSNFATYGMVNDWASSVKIPSGWTVTMYADNNFSGQSWTLTSNNSWFGGLSPSANDVVSSFKIQ